MIKSTVIPEIDLGILIGNFIAVAIIIAALLTFAYLVWGGFEWITSGGDKVGLEQARNRITNAFVGLFIVAAAWAIISLAAYFLGFPFPNISIPRLGGGGQVAGQCTDKNGNPGETCNNLNKCDIAGGCNPACCATNNDCPTGQTCSISNGYCKSGFSCKGP